MSVSTTHIPENNDVFPPHCYSFFATSLLYNNFLIVSILFQYFYVIIFLFAEIVLTFYCFYCILLLGGLFMEQKKYTLSVDIRTQLRFMRQSLNLSAEDVSVELGKSKAWLGQIERGKLLSIKREDLVELLVTYTNYNHNEILYDGVLDNFVTTGFALPDAPEDHDWYEEVDLIKDYFYGYLKNCTSDDERETKLEPIHSMLHCLSNYPGVTTLFFQNFILLENILNNYTSLKQDEYFQRVSALTQKINSLLNDEYNETINNSK